MGCMIVVFFDKTKKLSYYVGIIFYIMPGYNIGIAICNGWICNYFVKIQNYDVMKYPDGIISHSQFKMLCADIVMFYDVWPL